MTIEEAIEARHSVRAYKKQPLTEDVVKVLEEKIAVEGWPSSGTCQERLFNDWIYPDGFGHRQVSF